MFSYDVCEISKNSFFSRTRLVATSENAIFETEFKNLLISSKNDVPFSRYLIGYIFENIFWVVQQITQETTHLLNKRGQVIDILMRKKFWEIFCLI